MNVTEPHELAATVLEAMSQDSGPTECEPFTGWCVDLARALLTALERERALTEALDPNVVQIAREWIWTHANTNSDRDLGLGPRFGPIQHQTMLARAIDDIARAALAGSVAEEEQEQG